MKKNLKNNFVIILAFVLPIAFIVIVALGSYIPSLLISTNYNFVYATCEDNNPSYSPFGCSGYLSEKYTIEDNKLKVNKVNQKESTAKVVLEDPSGEYTTRIFLHDTKKNESREITLAEAQKFSLSELLTSPDGVTVTDNYFRGGDSFLFSGESSYGYYLTKGKTRKKLNLINEDSFYFERANFKFLGWVL